MLIQMKQVTGLLAALASKIGGERTITTVDGLTGGGDLSVNRTLGLTGIALYLHNMNTTGVLVRTNNPSVPLVARQIRGAAGQLTMADPDGVSGNPTMSLVNSGVQAGINYNRVAVDQFGRVVTAEAINYVVDDENYFKGTLNAKPLLYSGMGSAPPVLGTTRSLGLRVAFRNSTGPTVADLGIGADGGGLWLGLENNQVTSTLKFYGGVTLIGTLTGTGNLTINGDFAAATKSFLIDHPSKPGMKLQHGSLEGPEHAVYCRGTLTTAVGANGRLLLQFPDYWPGFVRDISLHLTPGQSTGKFWIEEINAEQGYAIIGTDAAYDTRVNLTYLAMATRIDVPAMLVEQPA